LTITLAQLDEVAQHHTLGRFRLSVTDRPRPVRVSPLPDRVAAALELPREQRTAEQREALLSYYRTIAPELQPVRTKIDALKKQVAEIPTTTLIMAELPKPRPSYMHVRGAFLSLGEPVTPGIPAIFRSTQSIASNHQDATNEADETPRSEREQNRLDLARWLVSDENPLTARVAVNRMWEQYFGTGIVATSEDFGTQGEPPTDQPLLDWLACEFMKPQSGGKPWQMKAIHKQIVMSATYRQSSNVTPEMMEKDPYNRLLARGPRFRLPAELIRDQALAVSGLLCEKMDGPSVFPPQPDGVWHLPYSGDRWVNSTGEDRYRRGVYTFYRRSAPYPMFVAFDKTTHETICTRRSRTDTPLQALAALNDPAFMETAAALARRIVKEGGPTPQSRVNFAFRDVLCRSPDSSESARLVKLYENMLKTYQADPQAATKVATSDLPAPPKELSVPELAAWTMVSNVLLNLDETLTKE
jgi:hypothetical protein